MQNLYYTTLHLLIQSELWYRQKLMEDTVKSQFMLQYTSEFGKLPSVSSKFLL